MQGTDAEDEAKNNITIASFYWSLLVENTGNNYTVDKTNTSGDGLLVYNTLLKTAQRGVKLKITQSYNDRGDLYFAFEGYPETRDLVLKSAGNVKVHSLDFTQWYPSGVLHTKSWVVDGKHLYVGSANFDWRSLTQVKELGIAVFNCPCLADDLRKLHKIYWKMGAPGAKIPKSWPTTYDTSAYHERPTTVPQRNGNQAVYFSASPPGFQSCHRESDIDAMVKLIDEAEKSLNMAVMDYAPTTLYLKPLNSWHGRLDEAIRRAAFDRQVKVRFMLSRWSHTYARFYSYLHSLQDLSSQLQCLKINGKCIRRGSIEVRLIQVPDMQYGVIPYSRVYHNKYFVTEKAVYVGTSNWTPDYWKYTAGIGMIIRPDDISQKSFIVKQFNQIFERDWNSNYTIPLSRFDNDGNWVNRTRYK